MCRDTVAGSAPLRASPLNRVTPWGTAYALYSGVLQKEVRQRSLQTDRVPARGRSSSRALSGMCPGRRRITLFGLEKTHTRGNRYQRRLLAHAGGLDDRGVVAGLS